MKVESSRKELKRCQLRNSTIQDEAGFVYPAGSNFYCEQKVDQTGHSYMRVYRSGDAESYWPFSLPDFHHLFIILR